ncbi:hypothetical protein D3C87_797710 [compost metagenome]
MAQCKLRLVIMIEKFIEDYERRTGLKETYVCPICLKSFAVKNMTNASGLTREHVPPQSLGGKVACYTCKECNSGAGASIDSELLKGIQFNKKTFLETMDEQKARVSRDGKTMQATVSSNGKNLTLKQSRKNNHPLELEKFVGETKKGTKLYIKYILPKFNQHLFNVGLLKTAYLMAFENQGYEIVDDANYDVVRQQLMNPNQKIYPFHNSILRDAFPENKEGVYIGEMDGRKVLVSVVRLNFRGRNHIFGVLLPYNHHQLVDFTSAASSLLSFSSDKVVETSRYIYNAYQERLSCLFTPLPPKT